MQAAPHGCVYVLQLLGEHCVSNDGGGGWTFARLMRVSLEGSVHPNYTHIKKKESHFNNLSCFLAYVYILYVFAAVNMC